MSDAKVGVEVFDDFRSEIRARVANDGVDETVGSKMTHEAVG